MAAVLQVLLVGLLLPAAAALPPSSVAMVGDLRVQTLSPTLVRVEAKGAMGFEDRHTFMVVNRGFGGVPITKTAVAADGSTHLTTAHYTVVVQAKPDQLQLGGVLGMETAAGTGGWDSATKNSTCGNAQANVDGASNSVRIAHNAVRAVPSTAACCAACDDEKECTAWVWDGPHGERSWVKRAE